MIKYTFREIKQRHLEDWAELFLDLPGRSKTAENGAAVRAAIRADWFESPPAEYLPGDGNGTGPQYLLDGTDVGEMTPWEVAFLASAVLDLRDEVTTIPKN